MADRRRGNQAKVALAFAVAFALHGLAGLGFLSVRYASPPTPDRAVIVAIEPQLTVARREDRTTTSPPAVAASPATAPTAPPGPSPMLAPPADHAAPPVAAPQAPPALSAALRGAFGCRYSELLRPDERERRHCAEQLAAGGEAARFGIDPGPRAEFDAGRERENWMQQPFLAMDPKNGCRPKVVYRDSEVPGRQKGDWRVTMGCGISF